MADNVMARIRVAERRYRAGIDEYGADEMRRVTQSDLDRMAQEVDRLRTRGLSPEGKKIMELAREGITVTRREELMSFHCERTVLEAGCEIRVTVYVPESEFIETDVEKMIRARELKRIGDLYDRA